ncbi:MAG: hypothetical protein R3D28_14390 [Geminicoccaceae bacterium]
MDGIIDMHWRLDSLDEPAWRRLLAAADRPALQQSWGYGVAVAARATASRAPSCARAGAVLLWRR